MKKRINREKDTVTVQFERFEASMIRSAIYYIEKGKDWHDHITSIEKNILMELYEKIKMPE